MYKLLGALAQSRPPPIHNFPKFHAQRPELSSVQPPRGFPCTWYRVPHRLCQQEHGLKETARPDRPRLLPGGVEAPGSSPGPHAGVAPVPSPRENTMSVRVSGRLCAACG